MMCVTNNNNNLAYIHTRTQVILKPKILSPRNIFIVNLACSDLLLCVFTMPFSFIEISQKMWHMGLLPCKLFASLQATSIFVSTISITAIALDRYKVIVYPTHADGVHGSHAGSGSTGRAHGIGGTRVGRGALLLLGCVWLGAMLLSLPLFSVRTVEHLDLPLAILQHIKSVDYCVEAWPFLHGRGFYSVITMIFQYVLPITIVSVVYAKISDKLQKRLIRRQKLTQLECQQQRQLEMIKRTHNILICVSLTVGLSWLPLNLLNVIGDFTDLFRGDEQSFRVVFAVCHLIGCSSACTNPVLYGYLNENFRKELVRVYAYRLARLSRSLRRLAARCCHCCDNRHRSTSSSSADKRRAARNVERLSSSGLTSSDTDDDDEYSGESDSDDMTSDAVTNVHQQQQQQQQERSNGRMLEPPSNIDTKYRKTPSTLTLAGSSTAGATLSQQIRRFSFQNGGAAGGAQTLGQTIRFCLCISGASSLETVATSFNAATDDNSKQRAGASSGQAVRAKRERARRRRRRHRRKLQQDQCACDCHAGNVRICTPSPPPPPRTCRWPGESLASDQPALGRRVWLRLFRRAPCARSPPVGVAAECARCAGAHKALSDDAKGAVKDKAAASSSEIRSSSSAAAHLNRALDCRVNCEQLQAANECVLEMRDAQLQPHQPRQSNAGTCSSIVVVDSNAVVLNATSTLLSTSSSLSTGKHACREFNNAPPLPLLPNETAALSLSAALPGDDNEPRTSRNDDDAAAAATPNMTAPKLSPNRLQSRATAHTNAQMTTADNDQDCSQTRRASADASTIAQSAAAAAAAATTAGFAEQLIRQLEQTSDATAVDTAIAAHPRNSSSSSFACAACERLKRSMTTSASSIGAHASSSATNETTTATDTNANNTNINNNNNSSTCSTASSTCSASSCCQSLSLAAASTAATSRARASSLMLLGDGDGDDDDEHEQLTQPPPPSQEQQRQQMQQNNTGKLVCNGASCDLSRC